MTVESLNVSQNAIPASAAAQARSSSEAPIDDPPDGMPADSLDGLAPVGAVTCETSVVLRSGSFVESPSSRPIVGAGRVGAGPPSVRPAGFGTAAKAARFGSAGSTSVGFGTAATAPGFGSAARSVSGWGGASRPSPTGAATGGSMTEATTNDRFAGAAVGRGTGAGAVS